MNRARVATIMSGKMALVIAASCISWTCGGGDRVAGSAELVVRVDTVNEVVRVSNHGPGPAWNLVEVTRIGAVGGMGPERPDEFGKVTGVVAGKDGTIYVADGLAHEIRAFSPEGEVIRRMGREGAGPGEFRSILSLGMLGDTIVVLDPGNGRLGLLSPAGAWSGQRLYNRVSGPDVRIFQTGSDEFSIPALRGGSGTELEVVYIRHVSAGTVETIPVRSDIDAPSFYVFCRATESFVYFVPEWAPSLLRVPAPGGQIAESWSGYYRIAFLDAGGDTIRVVERDLPRLIPTDEEWDHQVAQFDSILSQLSAPSCDPRRPLRPEEKALIRAILFDDQGRLWVERRTEDGFALDAFDHFGALRGSVDIPTRAEGVPVFIRGDRVYIVVQDELGVDTVLAFEVRTAEG
jgi:hypothetical protein